MRETYAILYSWIKPQDLPDIDGLCEVDDGVTFRQVIIASLRLVRTNHTQELISREYVKLDGAALIMRPGGMTAFFGKLNKHRLKLKEHGETVSEAYLLRRTSLAIVGKHKSLIDAMKAMRKLAGATGVPTTYSHARDNLIDTFQFETPDSAKNEQVPSAPITDANFAGGKPEPEKRKRDSDKDYRNSRRRRNRNLPKGSCKYCPNSTSHYTTECYVTIRKQKGLPNGWQWCLVHKKGTHYDPPLSTCCLTSHYPFPWLNYDQRAVAPSVCSSRYCFQINLL